MMWCQSRGEAPGECLCVVLGNWIIADSLYLLRYLLLRNYRYYWQSNLCAAKNSKNWVPKRRLLNSDLNENDKHRLSLISFHPISFYWQPSELCNFFNDFFATQISILESGPSQKPPLGDWFLTHKSWRNFASMSIGLKNQFCRREIPRQQQQTGAIPR